jgi:butyrate kinase
MDDECIFKKNIKHSVEELAPYERIADQNPFRKEVILRELSEAGISLDDVAVIVGRGGLLKPLISGVYEVNEAMAADLTNSPVGEHASNLGGLIARDIAKALPNVKAYIADPVVVDEMDKIARISGHPAFPRISIFHALNQKIIARTLAKDLGKNYEELNLIGVHLGGGTSIGAHKKGRVVDVNNALNGDGPFTPERSGSLPAGLLVDACFSGKYSKKEIGKMLKGEGGYVAYLGSNDALTVENRVKDGDKEWELIYKAMAYQIAKEIGGLAAAVFDMDLDAIFITGGVAYDKTFCGYIKQHVGKIAPVYVYPGEDEMKALAFNGLMVLNHEVEPKIYK